MMVIISHDCSDLVILSAYLIVCCWVGSVWTWIRSGELGLGPVAVAARFRHCRGDGAKVRLWTRCQSKQPQLY
jgi:hypothetical protein